VSISTACGVPIQWSPGNCAAERPQRKPTDHPHAGDAPLRIEEPVGVLIPQIALKCSGNIGVDFLEGDDVGARVADRSNAPDPGDHCRR
jgi:hypothetical protein